MRRGVNLIPGHRREALRRRRRGRWWAVICLAYAVTLGGAWATLRVAGGGADRAIAADLAETRNRVEDLELAIERLGPQLAEARASLAASRTIGGQPNWSVLLNLLAVLLGDDAVLSACELKPIEEPRPPRRVVEAASDQTAEPPLQPSETRAPERYTLRLEGVGRTQAAVADFVLRIERTELFDRVKLVETKKVPFGAEQAVAFEIECRLGQREESRR